MTRNATIGIALAATIVGVTAWRYVAAKPSAGDVVAIVHDRSDSRRDGCQATTALAARALDEAARRDHLLELVILATGDARTANEPMTLALPPPPRRSRRVMEGKSADTERYSEFLRIVKERCDSLHNSDESPIWLAVRRAIEHAKVNQSNVTGSATVYIQSDLEERSNQWLREMIRTGVTRKPPTELLDNMRINVVACGYAQTTGVIDSTGGKQVLTRPRSAETAGRVTNAWAGVFTDTRIVRFEPFCHTTTEYGSHSVPD